jgi:3-(3-hydroxy-phenyl)propionate hydroxylase
MTAALRLAQLGVEVLLLEAEEVPKTDWRASTFHCATLEILEPTGILPEMLDLGLRAPTYQLRDRSSGVVATFDFSLLASETAYPFRLQLNQQRLVGLLHARLAEHRGVEIAFGARLTAFSDDGDHVEVEFERAGARKKRTGAFLLGADGAASTVRRLLGVGFEGMTYAERFLIVSIEEDLASLLPDLAYVNYVADPVEWLFILRTPESWRVLFPIPEGETDEDSLSDTSIEARLQGVASAPSSYQLLDRQLYRVHQRVADEMASGRVLLMGDAAHINSPIGGVGLNSGIHDATDAALRLARVLNGGTDADEELRAYATVRRRVALDYVQADTHANTRRLAETDGERRWRELASMAEMATDPERAREHLLRVSLLEPVRRYGIGLPPHEVAEVMAS